MMTVLLAASSLTAPALAQERSGREEVSAGQDATEVDEIIVTGRRDTPYAITQAVTATKSDAPLLKTPQAITVVPEQVILDQAAQNLTDVLRNVSGITEANTFGNTGDNFLIRGFESGAGSVLRDGYATVQDRALNASTERVEVLKGPASLLYGRFEPGGLINVITKKPQPTFGYELSSGFSNQGQRRATGDITGPLGGGFAYRLIAEYEDSEYWRNVGRDVERTYIAPSMSWASGPFNALAQYEYLDSAQPFDRGRVYFNGERLNTPADRNFAEDFAEFTQVLHAGNLTLGYRIDPDWRLEGKLAIQRSTGDDLQVRPRTLVVDANGVPTGEFIRSVDGNRDLSDERDYASLNLHGKLNTFGLRHTLLFGVDYEDYESATGFRVDSSRRGGFNIFNPVYGLLDQNLAQLKVQPNSDFLQTFKTTGLYAQDLIEITDRWTLVLGGRYEKFEDFSRSGLSAPSDNSESDAFLPRVGAVYQPRSNVSIYASYSRAFAPNPSTPPQGDQPGFGPFPPEESRSYEIGVKAELFTGLTATLAAYDIEKRNVLVSRDIGGGESVVEAKDQITSQGIEFDLVGEITPRLSVIASYAYTDASDPQSVLGDNVVNVAKHTASLSGVYRFTDELTGLSFGGGVFHVGERFGGQSAGADAQVSVPFFLDSYTTLDLYAGYSRPLESGQTLFGRLTLRNATDEDYDQSSGFSALRVLPGQSRTLFATVGLRF